MALGWRNIDSFATRALSKATVDVDGGEVLLVGSYPVAERVTLLGKAGAFFYDAAASALGRELSEEGGTAMSVGIGMELALFSRFGLVFDARRAFDVSDTDLDWLTMGYLKL